MKLKLEEKNVNGREVKNENCINNENENNNINKRYNNNDNICDSYDNDQSNKNNKFNKNKSININGIIITDIANPQKKKKIKISFDNNFDNNKINKNIEDLLKSNNSITKITDTKIHNYGDIKIDTGDELLNKKNEEKNWGEIITLKTKNINKGQKNQKKENFIQLTSGKSSSILSSTKHNSNQSNDRKL